MNRTPQDFAAFLESLKVKKEGPEEMHGWRFDMHISYAAQHLDDCENSGHLKEFAEYLLYRCRRAESSAKPETLAEDVKAYMREIVSAYKLNQYYNDEETMQTWQEFRRLCEPTTDDKEHKQSKATE